MTVSDYVNDSKDSVELRRALAQDPEKLAAALHIVARAKRLDPDAGAGEDDKEDGDD
jgi:hypothetical protein